jgi:hypothetical protein
MTLNPDMLIEIDRLLWHSLPDENATVHQSYRIEDLTLSILRRPASRGAERLADILWAAIVTYQGRWIYVLALEREDLRSLADSLGCSLRSLQREYGTRSEYSEIHTYSYTAEERLDHGLWDDVLDAEEVIPYLLEMICDTFDLVDEPVLLEGEDKAPR